MEVALGLAFSELLTSLTEVLILVVVEVALGQICWITTNPNKARLNPCCSGGRTWTGIFTNTLKLVEYVSKLKNFNTLSCHFNTFITAKIESFFEMHKLLS